MCPQSLFWIICIYFDGSLKPHTLDAHGSGQFFSLIEATNGLGRQSFKVQMK